MTIHRRPRASLRACLETRSNPTPHLVNALLGDHQQESLTPLVKQAAEKAPRLDHAQSEVRVVDEPPARCQGGGVGLLIEGLGVIAAP